MLGERVNERIAFCEKIAGLRPLVLLIAVVLKYKSRRYNCESRGLKQGPRNFYFSLMPKSVIFKRRLVDFKGMLSVFFSLNLGGRGLHESRVNHLRIYCTTGKNRENLCRYTFNIDTGV
jgi:hypothetical protein